MGHLIFQDILIIFLISIPVVLLTNQLRMPATIGFLATGALIGPFGIGLISERDQIEILAEIGVTLLLFSVGLEFSFDSFRKLKYPSLMSGLLQISVTILVGVALGDFLGWSLYKGFYFGCVLALSSTALVLSTLHERRLTDSVHGTISTAILIIQDLAVVPMMAFLPLFSMTQSSDTSWPLLLAESGKAILIIALVAVFARLLASRIFRQILSSRNRDLFIVAVIAVALGMAWLTHHFGFSIALGAFLGGLLIGGTAYKYQALSEITPLRYTFISLFFVSIGMLLNFDFIAQNLLLFLALILVVPLIKAVIITGVTALSRIPLRIGMIVGISLGQIGEFSFLLAYTGLKMGVITPFFFQLIVAIAVVAMIITPIMVQQAPHIADLLSRLPLIRSLIHSEQERRLEQTQEMMKDHVIICGFGPLGEAFGRILKEHKLPYIVLEINPKAIEKIRRRNEPVFFGDGASADILYRCGIEHAKLLAITVPDYLNSAAIIHQARLLNPEICIVTRAKYRDQVDRLYGAGADIVVSEELEGGIEMSRYALKEIGLSETEVDEFIARIREFGSADFF